MEISQGNSLCSYLYLKQAKMSFLIFFSFFLYKIGEQEEGTGPARGGDVWKLWEAGSSREKG
jgi:hypothetical protein